MFFWIAIKNRGSNKYKRDDEYRPENKHGRTKALELPGRRGNGGRPRKMERQVGGPRSGVASRKLSRGDDHQQGTGAPRRTDCSCQRIQSVLQGKDHTCENQVTVYIRDANELTRNKHSLFTMVQQHISHAIEAKLKCISGYTTAKDKYDPFWLLNKIDDIMANFNCHKDLIMVDIFQTLNVVLQSSKECARKPKTI